MEHSCILFALFLLLSGSAVTPAVSQSDGGEEMAAGAWTCAPEHEYYGCSAEQGVCQCSAQCNTTQPYDDMPSCEAALSKEQNADPCQAGPCQGGICSQTKSYPGYKCFCFGTKHYGDHCEHACNDYTSESQTTYPFECILV